jgi:hypothetical protein
MRWTAVERFPSGTRYFWAASIPAVIARAATRVAAAPTIHFLLDDRVALIPPCFITP